MTTLRIRTILITVLTLMALSVGGGLLAPTPVMAQQTTDAAPQAVDRIVLRNGRVIEGKILSETSTQVRIMVIVAGIKAPTTYRKSEILSIEHDVQVSKPNANPKTRSPSLLAEERAPRPAPRSKNTGGDRIYLISLKGDLGREITKTPLQKVFDDAVASEPDVIVVKMDAGSRPRGFDGLWTAEALSPIIEKVIDDGWRVVFWIKRAEFGAAFLPFISPEIYFTSDGKLGGIGDLSDFDIGDETVNLKQISLRIGHAEGFAITGGYNPKLIRAMAIKDSWLAVRWRGGEPQYITWEPRPEDGDGWVVLTDDGQGDNKDEFSFEGNDVLTLDADQAQRLLVSKGAVDSLDDLAYELKLSRDYTVIDGKAEQILSDWRDRVGRAEDELKRLRKRFDEAGGSRGGRRTKRNTGSPAGRQINILKQIRGLLTAYQEVFDPKGQQRSNIDVQIEQLRESIRQSNKRRR